MDGTEVSKPSSSAAPGPNLLSEKTTSFEYAEMNLRHTTNNPERTIALVKRAIRMGYDAVVINVDVGDLFALAEIAEDDSLAPPPSKKKKKKGGDARVSDASSIPDPFIVDESSLDLKALVSAGKRFRQYSRLTVTLSDTSYVHQFFHSPQLKKYDVLAIRPANEQIFTTLTRKTEFFDIVTYDQTEIKVHWLSGRSKQIQQLALEGIGFEITYAEALTDSSLRRQVFANGRQLLNCTKRKNVFIASAASEVLDLRAPVDVQNMLVLFGIPARTARPHVSDYARDVLLRAEAKRTLKGAIAVTDKNKVPSSTLSQKAALAKLLSVPEFFLQIEKVPPKAAVEEGEKRAKEGGRTVKAETRKSPKKEKKLEDMDTLEFIL